MRLPLLQSSLCRSGGDTCDDFAPDRDGLCRHHVTGDATRDPACVLALAEDGPMTDGEIGDLLRVSRERVRQVATKAMAVALKRARLLRMRDAIDIDLFAATRPRVEPVPDGDEPAPQSGGLRGAIRDYIADGREVGALEVAEALGVTRKKASTALGHLVARGEARIVARGVWQTAHRRAG